MAETSKIDDQTPEFSRPVEVDTMPKNGTYRFNEVPSEAETNLIKAFLNLRGLRKMRIEGTIAPLGMKGWQLDAELGASVTQECVVTMEPVRCRIDVPVHIRYLPENLIPDDSDELTLEDEVETLEKTIDIGLVALEALAMALPAYPRADGANLGEINKPPPGAAPLTEKDLKPFASLADLRKKLEDSTE